MTKSLLADAFEHHAWATLRVLDACAALSPEQLATTVPGTYGSIIDTLRHLVGGDAGYLFVLTGGRIAQIDEADEARMEIPELRAAMERYGAEWSTFLKGDLDPDKTVTRHRDDGSESSAPLGIRLAQVLHHGSDHRSQICTALTQLGIEPPEIDVWALADASGRLEVTEPTS